MKFFFVNSATFFHHFLGESTSPRHGFTCGWIGQHQSEVPTMWGLAHEGCSFGSLVGEPRKSGIECVFSIGCELHGFKLYGGLLNI